MGGHVSRGGGIISKTAVEEAVPVTMPPLVGSLGFDIPLWAGLGMVGLWAALDGFAETAGFAKVLCATCGRNCIPPRFACYTQGNEGTLLNELEDLRHLYAHNYASGEADQDYFKRKRHVLKCGKEKQSTCGAKFDGRRIALDLPSLRMYSRIVRVILERIS